MINFNGQLIPENEFVLNAQNRAYKYGDAIFDTLKYKNFELQFAEDHYFRLMSSLRILRMKIPIYLTLEYYQNEIIKTIDHSRLQGDLRIRVSVYRKDGGLYKPDNNQVNMVIETGNVNKLKAKVYEIELFKDFPVFSGLLSTIKTNNRIINVVSSIFADENNYQNCILVNEKKNIVEANNANIFLIKDNKITTPSLQDGCINGIVRKKIIELIKGKSNFQIEETSISPFELLKADEVFLTNSISEIRTVNKYRKKLFSSEYTNQLRNLFSKEYYKLD